MGVTLGHLRVLIVDVFNQEVADLFSNQLTDLAGKYNTKDRYVKIGKNGGIKPPPCLIEVADKIHDRINDCTATIE